MLNLTLERIEREIRNLPVEHVYVLGADNEILFHTTSGQRDRVLIPGHEVVRLRGMLLTHNHPGGRSFSLTDVMLARKVELRELRAVTARQRFLIMPPEGGWASVGMEEFSATLNREKVLLLAELRDQIAKHRLTSAMVDLSFHQRLWERIAEAGLLRYRVESW